MPRKLLAMLIHLLGCVRELCRYSQTFLWAIFCRKAVLAARLPAGRGTLDFP